MDKKNVCIPSVSSIQGERPVLPDVVVGKRSSEYVVRRVSRPMRSGIRILGSGESINWDEVYN